MIGRRALISFSLLTALLFWASPVQSASASVSTNTTAVTCVPEGGFGWEDFIDGHCNTKTTPGEGSYVHETIAQNTTTEVSAINTQAAVLKGKIGLTSMEISCGFTKSNSKSSLIHNVQVEGKHTLTGTDKTQFTSCVVVKPAKCTVKEPIESSASVVGVEKLGAFENEMGVELKGTGKEETLAEISFLGAECALKGQTFNVKGSVIGTSGPTSRIVSDQRKRRCHSSLHAKKQHAKSENWAFNR